MDNDTFGSILYLFALMLPASTFCWTVALLALGFPRDPTDRPRLLDIVDRVGMLPTDPGGRMVFAVLGLILANAAQALILVRGPFGVTSALVAVYFLSEGTLLALLVREVRRPKSHRRAK